MPLADESETRLEVLSEHLWLLVPGLLVVYLGFDAGGYFAGTTGATAAALAGLLAVRLLTARRPFSGLTWTGGLGLAGLAALAGLSLVSTAWSHAPARALLAFDLVAVYLLLTALHTTVAQPPDRMRTLVCGVIGGLVVVCGAGLLTRTLPTVFPVSPEFGGSRLDYPVTYWNALGLLSALGIVLCGHVASDRDAAPAARVLVAGLIPGFAATLLFTFSRGAIAALAVAVVLYVVLAPRWSVVTTAVSVVPFTGLALLVSYQARLLGSADPTSTVAAREGWHVAAVLAGCTAGAWAVRSLLLRLEPRLPALSPPRVRRPVVITVVLVAVAALALIPATEHRVSREYRKLVDGVASNNIGSARGRLTSLSSNGRIQLWRVALDAFVRHPLHGTGAGTYALLWDLHRPGQETVQDAHDLYLQTLAELGIPGGVALAAFLIGLLLAGLGHIPIPSHRPVAALAVALFVAWALHGAIDWDWQQPVLLVPVFALMAAAATMRPPGGATRGPAPSPRLPSRIRLAGRALVAATALAIGLPPALVAVSQAHLDAATNDFARGNCAAAEAQARAAHTMLAIRPEPLEVLGYCQVRTGADTQAVRTMRAAVHLDPDDWEFHYALAVATLAEGGDPVPQLARAIRLDPLESLPIDATFALRDDPRTPGRRIALSLVWDVL